MLVEDEAIISTDIKIKLEKLGYSVARIVRRGGQVVEAAMELKPDLVLMDISLEGDVDGIAAASALYEKMDTPVVFLTSHTDQKTINNAKQLNTYGFLIKPVGFEELKTALDIAFYKAKIEKKLRESELLFKTIGDFTYDWESWISPEKNYIYVSPSCERITGYKPEVFLKNPDFLLQLVEDDHKERVRAHFANCLGEQKQVEKIEFEITHADGKSRWIEHICQPVFSPKGEYLGRRASSRDISIRKKAELERKRLIEELQKALAEVKQLSGLLPICSFCKKIRDDKGYWNQLESYISQHSDIKFSHSVCQSCIKEHYPPEMAKKVLNSDS